MELKDLRKSVSEMSDDELRASLLAIRQNRRVSKKPAPAARKTEIKAEADMSSLLAGITAEQAAELLKMMGGQK